MHPAGHEPRLRLLRLRLLLLHCSAELRAEEDAWTGRRSHLGSMGSKVSRCQLVVGLDSGDVVQRTTFSMFFVLGHLLRKQFEKVQLAEGF